MTPTSRLLATALVAALATACASTPPIADKTSEERFSESEIAYAAARLQKVEFAYGDMICADRPGEAKLVEAQAAFDRAHPGYRAALDGPAPEADVVAATDALVEEFLRVIHPAFMTARSLTPAQRDAECAQLAVARAGTDFAKKREQTRLQLSAESP